MKTIKIFVAFPIIASGFVILSTGAAVFCVGCLIAEKLPNKLIFGGKK